MSMNSQRDWNIFAWLTAGITLLALFLGSSRQFQAIPAAGHDDRLFINQAFQILQGNWLGDYTQLTLIKGPFYPLFIAINHLLGMPLLISQQVFYCLSGLMLIYALSYFCRNRGLLLLLYSLYVFYPGHFALNRVLREGIYPALTTLAIAGGLLMVANLLGRVPKQRIKIYHTLAFGLSLTAFWLTREEGIWILPTLGGLIAMGAIANLWQHRSFKTLLYQSLPLMGALSLTTLCLLGVASINNMKYGVFLARSELVSRDFKDANGALLRVKAAVPNQHVPVSRETRERIYAKSPRFRELQPYLDVPGQGAHAWTGAGCSVYPSSCGDYAGSWFTWALRDAVTYAGYKTAPEAFQFYRSLAQEVNSLCDTQQLDCFPARSGIFPPLGTDVLRMIPKTMLNEVPNFFGASTVNILAPQISGAVPIFFDASSKFADHLLMTGDSDSLQLFAEMTRNLNSPSHITHCPLNHLEVSGWAIHPGGNLRLTMSEEPAIRAQELVLRNSLPSPDLVTFFKNPSLVNNRFQLDICCKICRLSFVDSINRDAKELATVDLLNPDSQLVASGAWGAYHLDAVKPANPPPLPTIDRKKFTVIHWVNVHLYQRFLYFASLLAIALWAMRLLLMAVRVMPWSWLYAIATTVLMAIVIRMLILSIIDLTSFPGFVLSYVLPASTLTPVFTVLILGDATLYRLNFRHLRGGRSEKFMG